ncbi:hypothetical protein L0P88_23335 [Muricauda sp. SCSIO 64092]|uniref:hypothetical protein n=1 Tax=Allomuricauda sp. SCSIO 64092 TaxID=2908842 RepID=UPI001FF250E4|nr:hypothetical protein [Muricauda sp. SCSIO 64092]UOY06838.1 hypothetical protein L0P88_23335 [Muricauda sp. SCSIO 64092]
MSSIQDMNNRMKQNRNLRPSKRAKFKENNRGTIYTESNSEDKPTFREFSAFQVKKTIDKFRQETKAKKRLELIVLIVFLGAAGSFISYQIISKKDNPRKPEINKSTIDYYFPTPIVWSGKLSEPLRVPHSDYFYIPMVGNLDYVDLGRTYRIFPNNMVVDYTSNILFLDKNCDILGKLLPENGSIRYMMVIPNNEGFEPKKIIYRLTQDEPNVFGKLYNIKKHYVYISDLDGNNLTKITDREVRSFQWDNERKEIVFYFFYNKKMNDSIHGVFNMESNTFRLISRLE